MGKKAFLGVGHGGRDPGAVANGFKEKDLNLPIALACRDELERHGVLVLMSRTVDESEKLNDKIAECNAFNPDIAADFHNNAGGGDGAEVYHSQHGGTGKVLAENILEAVQEIGQNSRGAKTRINSRGVDGYLFIRNTYCPAVIFEGAFLDNKKDIAIIDTAEEQKIMGIAVAKGMLKTLGIEWKAPVEEEPKCNDCISLRPLKKGDKGDDVRALQILLAGNGCKGNMYEGGYGSFGGNTEGAVKLYQQKIGVPQTGEVDAVLWRRLIGVEGTT